MRTMHLFAGIGGGLLADLILGHTPIVAVEWEPYACQVLRERAAEGWFPDLSVWEGDVRLFDPSEYAGNVDCIHAGFPCQDISVAGKQAGVSEGTRSGLYREVLRIADIVRPRYLFLENVAAILSNGLGTVLADLAAMGYDSRWLCIRASDVGAPHHRDRWFALCTYTGHAESQGWVKDAEGLQHQPGWDARSEFASLCGDVADTSRELPYRVREAWERRFEPANICEVPNSGGKGLERQREISCGVGEEFCDTGDSCWWNTEPGLGRVADGVSNRMGQLKGYGNAQVPLQAAVAWKLLGGE